MSKFAVCRLCLTDLHDEMQSLLNPHILLMLSALADLQVAIDNKLSTVSCLRCVEDLRFSYKFRQNILRADNILRSQITKPLHQPNMKDTEVGDLIDPDSDNYSESNMFDLTPDAIANDCDEIERITPKCVSVEYLNEPNKEVNGESLEHLNQQCEEVEGASLADAPQLIVSTLRLKCSICLQKFFSNDIKDHIKDHHEQEQRCEDCNDFVGDAKSLQNHIEQAHGHVKDTEFKCEQCMLSFQYKAFFYVHKKAHQRMLTLSEERPNQNSFNSSKIPKYLRDAVCSVCFIKVRATNLAKHMKTHTPSPQECKLCGTILRNEESLRGHMAFSHSSRKLQCDKCGKIFKLQASFTVHMLRHTNKKEYVCDSCGGNFLTRHLLWNHIRRVHMQIRPYKCSFCSKAFFRSSELQSHLRQHTNNSPYKCDLCSASFKQGISLRTHRKSKHKIFEEITVTCQQCGKGFGTEHALKTHMRMHS